MRFLNSSVLALIALSSLVSLVGCSKPTPKETAKAFASAMGDGDGDKANKYCTGGDPKVISALAKMVGSSKKYHDAMVAKFGDGSLDASEKKTAIDPKEIDNATETINGDTATITPKSGEPIKLKRVDGEWKIDATELNGKAALGGTEGVDKISAAMSSVADDVNAGKFKTAGEAQTAMMKKMMGM